MQRVASSTPGALKRVGRAGLEAQRAVSALIERWLIAFEREAADDLAEKHPRAEVGMDDAACSCQSSRCPRAGRRRAPGSARCPRTRVASNGTGMSRASSPGALPFARRARGGSRRPTHSARSGHETGSVDLGGVGPVGVVDGGGDNHALRGGQRRWRTSARRPADRVRYLIEPAYPCAIHRARNGSSGRLGGRCDTARGRSRARGLWT